MSVLLGAGSNAIRATYAYSVVDLGMQRRWFRQTVFDRSTQRVQTRPFLV